MGGQGVQVGFLATQTLRMADATWRRVGDLEQKLALSNTRSSGRKKKRVADK